MTRPIDAYALNIDRDSFDTYADYIRVFDMIAEAPTVNAVSIIRCKDCTHYDGYYCHNKWWGDGYGNYTPPIKKKEGFCDWAERREENE